MTAYALISGRVVGEPELHDTPGSTKFATLRLLTGEPDHPASRQPVSVIGYAPAVVGQMMALEIGDSLAVTGRIKPRAVMGEDDAEPVLELSLVAERVLSLYTLRRKRAMTNGEAPAAA